MSGAAAQNFDPNQPPELELSDYEGLDDPTAIVDNVVKDVKKHQVQVSKWQKRIAVSKFEKIFLYSQLFLLADCFAAAFGGYGFLFVNLLP